MISATGWAQAPNFLWSTNIAGKVIGVDSLTNVYVQPTNALGSVIKLDASGNFISSNNICPLNGLIRIDSSGNYFFAGIIGMYPQFGGYNPGTTVNFGNGVVIGTNDFAIAKYNNAGNLLWARGFGPSQFFHTDRISLNDLEIDPNGVAYVGFSFNYEEDEISVFQIERCDDTTNTTITPPSYSQQNSEDYGLSTRVGPLNPSGGYALTVYNNYSYDNYVLSAFTTTNATQLAQWSVRDTSGFLSSDAANESVFADGLGNLYDGEGSTLNKRNGSGNLLWTVNTTNLLVRPVAGDFYGGVHIADGTGLLARYDTAGNLAWSTNYGSRVNQMITDSNGNRFISRDDGIVARLQPETVIAPVIVTSPTGGEIFSGSNFTFTVNATGFTPFVYSWYYQSTSNSTKSLISGATNGSLTLTAATASQSGSYSVVISNSAGSVTSMPVRLQVDAVAVFSGGLILTNGSYYFANPPTLTIVSAFTNGQSYYTLDGSMPTFGSTLYTGPFALSNNATINVLAYSADFSQSSYSDTSTLTVASQLTLSVSTAGGGTVTAAPPGGAGTNLNNIYASNAVVTVTATPASGFKFLYWQGASSLSSATIQVKMTQNQSLVAVFGTTLTVTATGFGQILISQPANYYPYGTLVRLEPFPQSGSYFATWGNAASGNTVPLNFAITNANPVVSALFVTNGANQSALTVLVLGKGSASLSPTGNIFTNNQSISLTATPASGQSFLRWTEGTNNQTANPLVITAGPQNRVITAHFTGQTSTLSPAPTNSYGPSGFTLMVSGDPGTIYQIQRAPAFTNWQTIGQVTNSNGTVPFTDPSATNAQNYYRAVLTP